jgi:3-dehydrotetronate 4-kinase
MNPILLGCIADDFTGATDLANNLVRSGMRTLQTIGIPEASNLAQVDAVVISLKTRTIPVDEAIEQALRALAWLQASGAANLLQVLLDF